MARRLLLELIADPAQMLRSLKQASAATDTYSRDLKQLGLTAEQSARKQVEAATKRDARLRAEVTAYKQLASAASHGSREQVVAANKAAEAERVLARSLGTTSAEARAHARSVATSERELGRFSRGALAGSGIMRGLGRSLAFASGGFLVFASASEFLRKSIEAATEAAATERQLAAQFRAVGQDADQYRQHIEDAALATSRLSGFTRDDLVRSFTTAFRATRDVDQALTIMRASADAARGSHKDLAAVTLALTKAWGGSAQSLRRLGILLPATAKGMDAIAFVQKRFAGQAEAGTTAQQRFGAALHNTQETVGTALLPTLERYLNRGSAWLGQAKNQARVQRDVTETVKVGSQVVHGLADAVGAVATVVRPVNRLLGGTERTVTLLAAAFVLAKVQAGLAALGLKTAGTEASIATGRMAALRGALLKLSAIGTIFIAVEVAEDLRQHPDRKKLFTNFRNYIPGYGTLFGKSFADQEATVRRARMAREQAQRSAAAGGVETPSERRDDPRHLPAAPATAASGRLRLAFSARFARTELRLAQAQLTETQADDRRILQVQAALIRQQIKLLQSRKGTFRKRLELTQQLVGVEGQIAGLQQATDEKRDQFLRLELRLAQAQLTKTQTDDREILRIEAAVIRKRIAALVGHLKTRLELTQQLVGIENQISSIDDEAERKRDEARKKRVAAAKKAAEQARQALAAAVETARQEIGALFQGPVLAPTDASIKARLGVPGPDPAKLLADIRAQTAQALRFERDLRKLRALGVGKATINELRGQGTEATASIEAILRAPRGQRANLIRALVAREGAAQRIGQMIVHTPKVTVHANHVVVSGGGSRTLQNSRSGRYAGN